MGCRGKGTLELFKGYYGMVLMELWECVKLSMECLEEGPKVGKGRDCVAGRNKPGLISFLTSVRWLLFITLPSPVFSSSLIY